MDTCTNRLGHNNQINGFENDRTLDDTEECVDNDENCQFWATLEPSECETNPDFMLSECKKACRACGR